VFSFVLAPYFLVFNKSSADLYMDSAWIFMNTLNCWSEIHCSSGFGGLARSLPDIRFPW